MLHAVIMAGGSGTRFWPDSTQDHPKQFLTLFGERTMLQATVDRIESLIPRDRIWVITNERYIELVEEQLPGIPPQNIVGEPVAKNTAPCVALAAALIKSRDKDGTMLVLPADHLIEDNEEFLSVLDTAVIRAEEGGLVTIGIKPDRPETGYGYIRFDQEDSLAIGEHKVKRVIAFTEKPDEKTAESFMESGDYLWNSGMFVWTASVILHQFEQHQPEIFAELENLDHTNPEESINSFYHNCPSISIDYGIMEHADTVYVVPGDFGWSDAGSWKAVYDLLPKDQNQNVIQAENVIVKASWGNLVQSKSGKCIALVGVDNLAVVETGDAILICDLNNSQEVKQVVEYLKKDPKKQRFL